MEWSDPLIQTGDGPLIHKRYSYIIYSQMGQLTTLLHAWMIMEDLWPKLEDQRKGPIINCTEYFKIDFLTVFSALI